MICGKVGDVRLFESVPMEDKNFVRVMTDEEVLEKYKDLEIVELKDSAFHYKFIPVKKEA